MNRRAIVLCPLCHKEYEVQISSIKNAKTKGCRCISKRPDSYRKHQLYPTWNGIMQRCNNIKAKNYKNYGEKGIKISNEFKDIEVFIKYIEVLPNYEKRLVEKRTLDRINNNGNYERGNLRWATGTEQVLNQNPRYNRKHKYPGIQYNEKKKRWVVSVTHNNKCKYIGMFKSEKEGLDAKNKYIIYNNLPHKIEIYE